MSYIKDKYRIAKKVHKCQMSGCDRVILEGERYQEISFTGEWTRHRYCNKCAEGK